MSPKTKLWLRNNVLLPVIGTAICLGIWHLVSLLTYDAKQNRYDLPSPRQTWEGSIKYFAAPFTDNKQDGFRGIGLEVVDSLILVMTGYTMALCVAVPVGFALGASKVFERLFDPVFQILRPVSPLAWFPLMQCLALPIKRNLSPDLEVTKWQCILTIAICSVWPTILNTAVGVRAIPQDYLNVAKVLKLGTAKRFFKVLLPATLPYMFTGFRLSLGIAWLVIVAAEMLAGKFGIGFFLANCYNTGDYASMIAAIIVIGCVGFVLDRLMSLLEQNIQVVFWALQKVGNGLAAAVNAVGYSRLKTVPGMNT